MSTDPARLLAEHAVHLPALESVPGAPAGVPVLGFPADGERALDWWRRVHALAADTGWWPVLLEPDGLDGPAPGAPADRLAQVDRVDVEEVLSPGGATLESLEDWRRQDLLDRWVDDPYRVEGFAMPFTRDGDPRRVTVVLVAATAGWQLPALLGWGDHGEGPPSAVHSAVLRRWQDRYGASVVCLGWRNAELAIGRPSRTRAEALALAWDYAGYCPDGVDAVYEADDVAGLAACLIDATTVLAAWD